MALKQLEGQEADARADIFASARWSTRYSRGKKAFEGNSLILRIHQDSKAAGLF